MPQLVPEMTLERCNETEHHESGCLLGVVDCQSWPIWMVGCADAETFLRKSSISGG